MHRLSVAATLWLAGCSFDVSYGDTRFQCQDDRGCPDGTSCSDQGFCEAADGGELDAAPVGQPDGPPVDGPPALVAQATTTFTAAALGATKETGELTVAAGDLLVAFAITEDDAVAIASIAGGEQDWSVPVVAVEEEHAWVGMWTAEADADRSMTVSFTLNGDSMGAFGGGVMVFRGSSGVGAVVEELGTAGSGEADLVTTGQNSAIVVAVGDWNAMDGSARVWLEEAGDLDEAVYFRDPGAYTAYAGVHRDAGAPRSFQVGLESPDDQVYSLVALEVLGSSGD